MSEQFGWLIERRNRAGSPIWWTGIASRAWSTDASDGCRFARETDAQRVIWLLDLRGAVATEHGWGLV